MADNEVFIPKEGKVFGVKTSTFVRWFFIFNVLFLIALGVTGIALGAWAVDQINNNLPQSFSVFSPKLAARDEASASEDYYSVEDEESYERTLRAALTEGVILKQKGTVIQATSTQVGLGLVKNLDGSVYSVNTGVVSIATGPGIVSTPVPNVKREDEDENADTDPNYERLVAAYPTGQKLQLANSGVNTLSVHPVILKRGMHDARIASSVYEQGNGIILTGTTQYLQIINDGVWAIAHDASLTVAGNASVPVLSVTNWTPITSFSVTVTHTDLASAASFPILVPSSLTARYSILSVASTTAGSVNWSVGDRSVYVQTNTVSFYQLTTTTLTDVGTTSYTIGNTDPGILPVTGFAANAQSAAGETIYFKYSGGTTDYSGGSLVLHFVMIQTAQ